MNRRGFLGSVAGAVVGGTFRRLAPASPPPALDPDAFYGIYRSVDPRPTSAFIDAACLDMEQALNALRGELARSSTIVMWLPVEPVT